MPATEDNRTLVPLHRPSLVEKLFFLFSGIVVSIPIAFFFEPTTGFLKNYFPGFEAEVLAIAVFAPIIEEFAKAYPLFYRHGESQRSIMMLGFLVGVGFGITEFFEYVVIIGVPILVRLPGIFFHGATAATIAYGIATKRPAAFYLISVLLHCSINLIAIYGLSGLPYALVLTITYVLPITLYRKTSERIIPY